MSDREYRSAEKGESCKIRLEAVISNAIQTAVSKELFIMLTANKSSFTGGVYWCIAKFAYIYGFARETENMNSLINFLLSLDIEKALWYCIPERGVCVWHKSNC